MNGCGICTVPGEGGFCERHGVHKSPAWVRLCTGNAKYFTAWEEGRGLGQDPDKPRATKKPKNGRTYTATSVATEIPMPPLAARIPAFLSAMVAFISDGLTMVSRDEYHARLAVCAECDYRKGNWCRKCGCNLAFKARGRVFQCPENKWPTTTVATKDSGQLSQNSIDNPP